MAATPYDFIAGDFAAVRTRLLAKEEGYLARLIEGLPTGSTILDLGCGTGMPIATHLVSRGFRIVGVDESAAMLALARERLPEQRWMHARMAEVELDESFAAVVCWDALFHQPRAEFRPILEKVHRWLAPGGRLLMSSGYRVDEAGTGFHDTMFGHSFYYDSLSPRQLAALLEELGFESILAELCGPPQGERDKGKWATLAAKKR